MHRFSHWCTQQDTQLFTYLLKQPRTVCHALIHLFTFASWLSKTSMAVINEMRLFRGPIAPKLYISHQNSTMKGTSLGCRLVPEMIPTAGNCAVWAIPISHSQTPPQKYPFWVVLGPVKPLHRNSEIFQRFMHVHTESCLLFLKCSKLVQYKWPKVWVVLMTEKSILASLGATPEAISPNFCEYAPWPLTYIPGFIQISSGLGRYKLKNPSTTPRINAVQAVWAYN